MELEVERNHIRCSLSAGEKFNSLLVLYALLFTALSWSSSWLAILLTIGALVVGIGVGAAWEEEANQTDYDFST